MAADDEEDSNGGRGLVYGCLFGVVFWIAIAWAIARALG